MLDRAIFIAILPVLALLAWAALSNDSVTDHPDPEFLATDLFFRLDDAVISVPAVSVLDLKEPHNSAPLPGLRSGGSFSKPREFANQEYKDALLALGGNPTRPAELTAIWLNFGVYGTYGERTVSSEICPMLSKEWSEKACRNQLRKELKNLPETFHLSTKAGMEAFARHHFSGLPNVTLAAVLGEMHPFQNTAKAACADSQRFCFGAISVTEKIFAFWPHSCTSAADESCRTRLEAEGTEILKLVEAELRTY